MGGEHGGLPQVRFWSCQGGSRVCRTEVTVSGQQGGREGLPLWVGREGAGAYLGRGPGCW